jgi:TonB family protein
MAAEDSPQPTGQRQDQVATASQVPELAVPAKGGDQAPGTVSIRVEVDETGSVVEAVLIPQTNVNPEFAEAALLMARDWRFEASRAGSQHTTRVLQFRQSANR